MIVFIFCGFVLVVGTAYTAMIIKINNRCTRIRRAREKEVLDRLEGIATRLGHPKPEEPVEQEDLPVAKVYKMDDYRE